MSRRSGNCAGARSYPTGRTAIVPIENVALLLIRPCQEIEETVGGLFVPLSCPGRAISCGPCLECKPMVISPLCFLDLRNTIPGVIRVPILRNSACT